ncbi:MAG: alpha/beta hydrolase [Rhodospirillaceae bacterium]|nr:alpha/beta hydrolase [Rhodospirillaceae bacterium]MDD9927977.1 alpha/beta hydrolase [Rhodospirillaceae bacterium]
MMRDFAKTAEGRIYFEETGAGPALILLHPSPQSSRVYWRLMPVLAERFRVIAVDTLGFGRSDPLPDGITMERLGGSVGAVMTELRIEQAHLFGFHTGNKIAAAIAANWPDRVDRLVLCGQTHSLIADQSTRIAAFGPITDRFFESKTAEAEADSAAAAHMQWATEMFADMSRLWWDKRAIAEFGYSSELRRYLAARISDLLEAKPSAAAIYAANFGFDFEAALRRVAAPSLVIEVASKAEAHLGPQAARLAALMPNAQAATIEEGDREVLEMRTEEVARLVLDFLPG